MSTSRAGAPHFRQIQPGEMHTAVIYLPMSATLFFNRGGMRRY